MACTNPISAYSRICPATGLKSVDTRKLPGRENNLLLPCNKCLSCKLRKAKEWALRCWHESQMHDENSFVTLTYADQHLPAYHDLDHRDFQLFMKRFRKHNKNVKFYMCGEYGDETHRPHFHVLLFGYYPPDAVYHRTENGFRYYKSQELDSYWKLGFTDTSNVSYKNAGYIARYTLKKQLPKEAIQERYTYLDTDEKLQTRKLEYVRMSTGREFGTGIGGAWFKKYAAQTCLNDYVLDPDRHKCPVPRYYLSILKEDSENYFDFLAAKRLAKAKADPNNDPSFLPGKAICAKAKLKQLPRPYL